MPILWTSSSGLFSKRRRYAELGGIAQTRCASRSRLSGGPKGRCAKVPIRSVDAPATGTHFSRETELAKSGIAPAAGWSTERKGTSNPESSAHEALSIQMAAAGNRPAAVLRQVVRPRQAAWRSALTVRGGSNPERNGRPTGRSFRRRVASSKCLRGRTGPCLYPNGV